MRRTFSSVVLAVGVASLLAACQMFEAPSEAELEFMDITSMALQSSVINFEELLEGQVVDAVSGPLGGFGGIDGHDTGGFVDVFGTHPSFPSSNAAIIFDAKCLPGGTPAHCTGGDDDLFDDSLGKILIISETDPDGGPVADPDDADVSGAEFYFDYSTWAPSGSVTIGTMVLDVIDVEEAGATITLHRVGDDVTIDIPDTDEDGKTTSIEQAVNVTGVTAMTVLLNGSGGIDNIHLSVDTPAMGCTPGFWRNWDGNGPQPNAWASTGYSPNQQFSSVFDDAFSGKTLGQVVELGGGGLNALGRHTVAALLNAAHEHVVYGISDTNDVIDAFNDVYPGSRNDYNDLKAQFEDFNEAGCPLSRNVY